MHESRTIIKWAVTDCLMMPMDDNSPLKQQEFWPVCVNHICDSIMFILYHTVFIQRFNVHFK